MKIICYKIVNNNDLFLIRGKTEMVINCWMKNFQLTAGRFARVYNRNKANVIVGALYPRWQLKRIYCRQFANHRVK